MKASNITVFILFGFLAVVYNQVINRPLVVYKVSKLEGCLSTEISFLSLVILSINKCAEECFLRPQCIAVEYERRFQICELLEFARTDTISRSGQKEACVYLRKSYMIVQNQLPSVCNDCVRGETCDLEQLQCVKKECKTLNINNGDVFGNMNSNGSRVKYACHSRFARAHSEDIATCLDGMWRPTPACITDMSSLTNVALGKPTKMSNEYVISHGSKLAVDGNTNQNLYDGSCLHTSNELRPWWLVDLEAVYAIDTVRLYNRMDCCGASASNVILLLGNTSETTVAVQYKEGQIDDFHDFKLAGKQARYVNLTLNATNDFHLCEVQVFGVLRERTNGKKCSQDSDCLETTSQCISSYAGAPGKCFCNRLYRYNSTSRDCERVCGAIQDDFIKYDNQFIKDYNLIAHQLQSLSLDKCKNKCLFNVECMCFEWSAGSSMCIMGNVSIEMINDADHSALMTSNGVYLYSRSCK